MLKLSDEFARAASAEEIGMSLIAFGPGSEPGQGGYWHTDPGVIWTNITLAGKEECSCARMKACLRISRGLGLIGQRRRPD
jgi:hypothetical protein